MGIFFNCYHIQYENYAKYEVKRKIDINIQYKQTLYTHIILVLLIYCIQKNNF